MAAPLYRAGSTKVGGGTNNVPQMVPGPGQMENVKPTVREVMDEFVKIPLIDGKTFWELENELEWV